MPWYSSWIPELLNFNFSIPASIQGRFLSFILKKTLGHFLKPGQLDYHQIDSQIGSGYVQVNDLELNQESINSFFRGLPIALQDGRISSVKVQVPWPNPLASTLGFSLNSLHLVFHVVPVLERPINANINLSQSVASVAERFLHEELSPPEEATLWRSFHQESGTQADYNLEQIPGGLEFSSIHEDRQKFEMEPAGVSIFAILIEKLLARFEFDAEDIQVTLVHPENMSLTLSLQEIRYRTTSRDGHSLAFCKVGAPQGESRTLTFTGISLSSKNLSHFSSYLVPQAFVDHPRRGFNTSIPRNSSWSSDLAIDEATQLVMSQSLASLPPQPRSPASSVSSSMYASAISTILPIQGNTEVAAEQPSEFSMDKSQVLEQPVKATNLSLFPSKQLLSFGSQSITLQLTTPSPSVQAEDNPFESIADSACSSDTQIRVDLSIGIVSFAVRPQQMWNLLCLVQAISPTQDRHMETSLTQPLTPVKMPPLKLDVQVQGIVLLLLPSAVDTDINSTSLTQFFNHPVLPPTLDCGYTRLYLESISTTLSISEAQTGEGSGVQPDNSFVEHTPIISFDSNLLDISAFIINPVSGSRESGATAGALALPLLLTDPHLVSQYSGTHSHPGSTGVYPQLPTFDIIDWKAKRCRNFGIKVSQWRSQPKFSTSNHTKHHNQANKSHFSSNFFRPAVRMIGSQTITSTHSEANPGVSFCSLEVKIAPLNVRVDLDQILQPGGPVSFFEDVFALESRSNVDQDSISSGRTVKEHQAPPISRVVGSSNSRFDLDLGHEQPDPELGNTERRHPQFQMVFKFPVVRLSVLCPPPLHLDPRSGILLVDVHDISIHLGAKPKANKSTLRFLEEDAAPMRNPGVSDEDILVKFEFGKAILASAADGMAVASSFASIGSLVEEHDCPYPPISRPSPLKPRICMMKPSSGKSRTTPALAISIDIPAVHVDIQKSGVDELQYWADDIGQLVERLAGTSDKGETGDSRDTSLIGSCFFVRSRAGSGFDSGIIGNANDNAESVLKFSITETFIRLQVPRTDRMLPETRPFDFKASDLDVLVELNADNKQQTILTLGIMDLTVDNSASQGVTQRFINLTAPHSLSTSPRSIIKLRLATSMIPEIKSKETRIKLTICGFTYSFYPDMHWIADLAEFAKNPPGTFEAVIPNDRTRISVKVVDGSFRLFAPKYCGAIVAYMQELDFSTDVVGGSRDSSFQVLATSLSLLATDDAQTPDVRADVVQRDARGLSTWTNARYALLAELLDLRMGVMNQAIASPFWKITIDLVVIRLHLCADSLTAVNAFSQDLGELFKSEDGSILINKHPTLVNQPREDGTTLLSSVEDLAFKVAPEIGPSGDLIHDDLPTNLDYLDESFGSAAGLRELREEDLDEFDDDEESGTQGVPDDPSTVSKIGGETIKIFESDGLEAMEGYFLSIPPDTSQGSSHSCEATFSLRIQDGDFKLFLYDGYDWPKTRKTIEDEVKEMRKRLAKIRQLVANGQIQDPTIEDTSTLLFNSVHIGLEQDEDALGGPAALIAAIDEELKDDFDASSQSSWQSLRTPNPNKSRNRSARVHGKQLTRSKTPSIEFCFMGLQAEFEQYGPQDSLVSRTLVTVKTLEILDHIKTSTWKKFLTELRSDSHGNVREAGSNMVRVELQGVHPVVGHSSKEMRLKAKILPLRLYVDQDAVDFLKKFFTFKDGSPPQPSGTSEEEAYIQLAEIFPIDLKLDYKPRRVDYRALKEGRTIELMNFFHFDGAEMTLRHITLAGVTGWPRLFEMLNDLWTPDVKATQLAEVISGVAPIRSIVNVGSGVADLILLPIAQYKKDGRIVRGVQKGATAFVKSTATEAIKMGAKLATGTQVILEQAEGILGTQYNPPITAEPVQVSFGDDLSSEDEDGVELISKYAQQPTDLREGVQSAYKSLQRNLSSAAQTILAVPMEVYERAGNEGPIRSVIRAVPIAVLKPMIGASEAVSKTLLGLHNTLDPNVRHENEAKYKLR